MGKKANSLAHTEGERHTYVHRHAQLPSSYAYCPYGFHIVTVIHVTWMKIGASVSFKIETHLTILCSRHIDEQISFVLWKIKGRLALICELLIWFAIALCLFVWTQKSAFKYCWTEFINRFMNHFQWESTTQVKLELRINLQEKFTMNLDKNQFSQF